MPIVALLDGSQVIGPLATPEQWEECKQAAQTDRNRLIMRSTGNPCFPRRSRNGLQHFAHYPGTKSTAPESVGHEMLKAFVAKSLQNAGWKADVELPSDNNEWIADVMGTSPSGSKVAFEVQLSRQTEEETKRRTERYKKSGIHTVWITPDHDSIPADVDAVILDMKGGELKKLHTFELVESAPAMIWRNCKPWEVESMPRMPLGEVLSGVLAGKTTYPQVLQYALVYVYPCYKCSKEFTSYEMLNTPRASWKAANGEIEKWDDFPLARPSENLNDPGLISIAHRAAQELNLPAVAGTVTGKFNVNSRYWTSAGYMPNQKLVAKGTYLTCPHCSARQGRTADIRYQNFRVAEHSGHCYEALIPATAETKTLWQWGSRLDHWIFKTRVKA